MNGPKKKRRLLLPTLAATGVLASGGVGAWRLATTADAEPASEDAISIASESVTSAAQEWADTDAVQPTADLFAKQASSDAAYPVQPAAYTAPAVGDRYSSAVEVQNDAGTVARGQSPSRIESSPEPSGGNPLRSAQLRSAPRPLEDQRDTEADEARRAFGAALAADVASSESREPAAFAPVEESREIVAAFDETQDSDESPVQPIPFEPGPIGGEASGVAAPAPMQLQAPSALEPPAPLPSGPPALPSGNTLRSGAPSGDLADAFSAGPSAGAPAPPQALPADDAPAAFGTPEPKRMASVLTEPRSEPNYADQFAAPAPPMPINPPEPQSAGGVGVGRPGDRAIEGRQQPTVAIQKFAPTEVQVGKPCKFVTKVRNMSQRPVVDVTVRDQAPAGARLVSTTPQADTSGADIRWDLGSLGPGEERTLEMELTPVDEGEIGSVATVTFAAQATARAKCTRPQLAIRMTAPKRVLVGRQQRVQIELKNPGTGDATGVMLTENVPENLRHEAGAALEFEVGTLRAGETRTLELVMNAEKPGNVINTLTARADGNLEVQQQVEFEVIAPALAVDLQGPKRRYLERPATYTVSIENPGTAAARDVRLVTRLPQGMRFVKANNLGEYDAATHSVYWSLAELPEGEGGKVQLTALPVTSGELTLKVEGQAREGLKDEDAMAVKIEGIAALKFEVLDVEDPIEVGGETVYEVRVANQGTKGATNVGVRFTLPPGMKAVDAGGQTQRNVQGSTVVFAPLERLAPEAEAMFWVRVQGVLAGDQRLAVEVSSDDLAQPVRKEESTRVFGDE